MDNNNKDVVRAKLEAIETELVEQMLFDVLHMKVQVAYKELGVEVNDIVNSLQHNTYKEIVAELKNRYRNTLNAPRR